MNVKFVQKSLEQPTRTRDPVDGSIYRVRRREVTNVNGIGDFLGLVCCGLPVLFLVLAILDDFT